MPIGYLERRRRLNDNKGQLRRKIRSMGRMALLNLITMPVDPEKTVQGKLNAIDMTAQHLRFLTECWLDQDEDVISYEAKKKYYQRHGLEPEAMVDYELFSEE